MFPTLKIALKMTAEGVMDEDTFHSVMADSDIPLYLFEPEYTAEEMQWREAEAVQHWWSLNSNFPPMPTEPESFCCSEFHHGQSCGMLS